MAIRGPGEGERCGNSMCRQPLAPGVNFCPRCGLVRIPDTPGRWSSGCLAVLVAAVVLGTIGVLWWFLG